MTPPRVRPPRSASLLPALLLALLLGACAPRTTTGTAVPANGTAAPEAPLDDPAAAQLERTALEAFHRMEIARLQTGAYTTNALVDLTLPRGTRWTVLEFADGDYLLRFTSDEVPERHWLVSPTGVERGSGG